MLPHITGEYSPKLTKAPRVPFPVQTETRKAFATAIAKALGYKYSGNIHKARQYGNLIRQLLKEHQL